MLKNFFFCFFENLFLLPNKISFTKKKDFLILDDQEIKNLTDYLNNYLSKFKQEIEKKISLNCIEDNYFFHINDLLDENSKNKIESVLSNNNLVDKISKFFGYRLKYTNFFVRVNFFNERLPEEEGPKMWHRDNDSLFGQLKLFLVVNQLNAQSGGQFYFIPKTKIPSHMRLYSNYDSNENITTNDKKSRIKNLDISEKYKVNNEDIISYGLNNKEALVLDTNDTYHKGGYLRNNKNYRILIQAIYEVKYFSLSNYNSFSKNFLYRNIKIILTGLKNRLRQTI